MSASNKANVRFAQSSLGVGGTCSRVMDTAAMVVKGLAGGDMKAALAGGASPWITEYIGHGNDLTTYEKRAPHAVVNAALAAAQGQNAAAGELTGMIASELYGKTGGALSELQKQAVSAPVNLGFWTGRWSGGRQHRQRGICGTGREATVENNSLSQVVPLSHRAGIVGLAGAAIKDVAHKMTSEELDHFITLEMMGNDEITGKYLSSLQDKYGSGNASNPNIGKDLTDADHRALRC